MVSWVATLHNLLNPRDLSRRNQIFAVATDRDQTRKAVPGLEIFHAVTSVSGWKSAAGGADVGDLNMPV